MPWISRPRSHARIAGGQRIQRLEVRAVAASAAAGAPVDVSIAKTYIIWNYIMAFELASQVVAGNS